MSAAGLPTAYGVINDAKRPGWLRDRRKGIGASDAPSVVGVRNKPTRLQIWLEKRGEIEPDPPSEQMLWGLRLEPLIAQAYCERVRIREDSLSTQEHHTHPEFPWMKATIDGSSSKGLVEFKAAGSWMGRQLPEDGDSAGLPEPWIIQVQHQMCVTGAQHVTLAAFADLSLRLYEVERDDEMIEDIVLLESEFWKLVESGVAPSEFQPEDAKVISRHFNQEEDWHAVMTSPELETAAEGFASIQKYIKEAKADLDKFKAQLLFAMGNASTAQCGPYVFKRKLINVKANPNPKPKAASSYIKFTCGEEEGEDE